MIGAAYAHVGRRRFHYQSDIGSAQKQQISAASAGRKSERLASGVVAVPAAMYDRGSGKLIGRAAVTTHNVTCANAFIYREVKGLLSKSHRSALTLLVFGRPLQPNCGHVLENDAMGQIQK